MARAVVTTQKRINLAQLASELGADLFGPSLEDLESTRSKEIAAEGVTDQALASAVASHTFEAGWTAPGPQHDWRTRLQADIDWLETQIATAPAAGTTTQGNAVARLDGVIQHVKQLDRGLLRLVRKIRDDILDAEE